MKIQSLSIHVPTGVCLNECEYCVSRMHESPYENRIGKAIDDISDHHSSTFRAKDDYLRRLLFAKENGVNTVILTGTGEAIQNKKFLKWFGDINKQEVGFRWIEIQTSGNLLLKKETVNGSDGKPPYEYYENFAFFRNVGVSTISLSVADIFDSEKNCELINMPKNQHFNMEDLCSKIKEFNFNLRISINVSSNLNEYAYEQIFNRIKQLGADQITLRELYTSAECQTPQDKWIIENRVRKDFFEKLNEFILKNGTFIGKLPFGANKYDIYNMSITVDNNCMNDFSKNEKPDTYKYFILRPNCKLYSDWSRKASLIF